MGKKESTLEIFLDLGEIMIRWSGVGGEEERTVLEGANLRVRRSSRRVRGKDRHRNEFCVGRERV